LEIPKRKISANANAWEYVLLQYRDGKIKVLIKADTLNEFDKDTKELLAVIVFTNLPCEQIFTERVDYFDIVDDF